jgi:NAD(P)-dependent dehydrogenase (short-subunit alcohol dehydrogenase family)
MGVLDDKTVVVTGGTTGIGYATAELFAKEGARIVVSGRDAQRVEGAAEALGAGVTGIAADQACLRDVERLAKDAAAVLGPIDVLVLNAGIALPRPVGSIDEAHYDALFDVNVKGPLFTLQAFLPHLADGASVIVTTSVLGRLGMPGMTVYSATKAAVRSMVRTWAAELKERNIRVNAIAPGPIETPIYGKIGLPADELEAFAAAVLAKVPQGRFGQPGEVAGAMLFLAGPHGSYVTGEEITVAGGWGAV